MGYGMMIAQGDCPRIGGEGRHGKKLRKALKAARANPGVFELYPPGADGEGWLRGPGKCVQLMAGERVLVPEGVKEISEAFQPLPKAYRTEGRGERG